MSVELQEAYRYEMETLNVEQLMAQMLGNYEDATDTKHEVTPLKIRNMLLAAKYLEGEAAKLKEMKKAVSEEWDRKINAKLADKASIDAFTLQWLENENKGEKLALDFATASVRKTKPNLVFNAEKKDAAINFLTKNNALEGFLKPAELDTSKLMDFVNDAIEKAVTKNRSSYIEKYLDANPDKPLSKKKEKELENDLKEFTVKQYAEFYNGFIDLSEAKTSLSVRLSK